MIEPQALAEYCSTLLDAPSFSDYAPNGLQVEGERPISRLITGVTASAALIEAAQDEDADALLVHHGWFWKGESPALIGTKGRRVRTLMASGASLIAYHLPLDAHPGAREQRRPRPGARPPRPDPVRYRTGIGLGGSPGTTAAPG